MTRLPHFPIPHFPTLLLSTLALLPLSGCWDNTPPPPRVPVPAPQNAATYQPDPVRPLAAPAPVADESAAMPFNDEPLVSQRPPEQARFLQTYNAVGRPRIVLFVNRTMEGDVIPAGFPDPQPTHATPRQKDTVYLQPPQYDEANARSLDYQALETILTDFLSCNGQTVLTSPTLARQRLSDETVKEMQAGRPQALSEIAAQLNADVLIQVAAHPTRQTPEGLEVRLVAEAMNIKGGQSIGRAVVDCPPPLDKPQINKYARYLARKLMDDMTQTWQAPPPPDMRRSADQPATSAAPASTPAPAPSISVTPPSAPTPPAAPTSPYTPPTAPVAPTAPAAPQNQRVSS